MKTGGGGGGTAPCYLTSTLGGGELSFHVPAALLRGSNPRLPLIGGLVWPRAGLEGVEKRKSLAPTGNRMLIPQPPSS
jgi:hypothetical protein